MFLLFNIYYLVIKGQEIFHATAEEFDYEAPKNALETIRHQLESELSLDTDQVDQLIFYLQANVTDEADEIDEASFSHIVAEMGEVNGKDYFEDEKDACNRIWISTAQNLSYETIVINQDEKSLEFDDEILDQKEVVSWSKFKVSGDIDLNAEKLSAVNEDAISKRKSYSDEFKRSVAIAANKKGATLASVGEEFRVNPTLVRNWKLKFNQEN